MTANDALKMSLKKRKRKDFPNQISGSVSSENLPQSSGASDSADF